MNALTQYFIISLALLTTACGWHLRGAIVLPDDFKNLYISNQASPSLAQDVGNILRSAGVEIVDSRIDAQYTLHLLEQRNDKRTAGVGGDGLANAYELFTEVDYKIVGQNGLELVPQSTATAIRSYNFETGQVLSANEEEKILRKEMNNDIVQQIARSLRYAKPAQTPNGDEQNPAIGNAR